MKKKKNEKQSYLVANDDPIFPDGDVDIEIPDDLADELNDDQQETDVPANDSSDIISAPASSDDEEPSPLTGKKAAFFDTVGGGITGNDEDENSLDWLDDDADKGSTSLTGDDDFAEVEIDADDFEEIELDDDILMGDDDGEKPELVSVDKPTSKSSDFGDGFDDIDISDELDDLDDVSADPTIELSTEDEGEAPEEMTGRKAALFHSVEPTDDEMSRVSSDGEEESLIPDEEDEIDDDRPSLAPTKPLDASPTAPQETTMDKVAAEYGGDASVFGSVGGRGGSSKKKSDILKTMKYLNQETIAGLDLWEDGATACLLRWNRGKLQITHAGHIEFPEGAGDLDKASLLKGFWKNLKMPTRSVWVNAHNASLLQKYVRYDMPIEELEVALHRDAEESMPGAVGNVVIDWMIKDRFGGGGEGLLFALPVWEQEHLLSLLRKAGLYICGMSVAACDIARLLTLSRPDGSGENNAECVCSLSRTGADIVISYGKGSLYSRTVYSRAGGWEKNLPYLFECMNDAVNHFNSWISRNPVATVLLCGQVPEVEDLSGEMLRETGLLVEIWNPVADSEVFELTGAAKRSGVLGRNLVGCLGLAMERG